MTRPIVAYKLFRERADGSLTPLFIDKTTPIPFGKWLKAKALKTKGFKFRPGWHACAKPVAPHLSKKGRVWCYVELDDIVELQKPEAQGGTWYLAKKMRLVSRVED